MIVLGLVLGHVLGPVPDPSRVLGLVRLVIGLGIVLYPATPHPPFANWDTALYKHRRKHMRLEVVRPACNEAYCLFNAASSSLEV